MIYRYLYLSIMMDYFGSIEKTSEEVDMELILSFKNYNPSYIQSISSAFRNENMICNVYSVSGWMVFFRKEVIQLIETKIKNDTENVAKKLLLVRYCIENETPLDIIRDL